MWGIVSARCLQHEAERICALPLVKGGVYGGLLPTVNMGLKQMLGGMSYIEQCRLSLRKAVNEKLGLKFGPLDVREFL